MSEPLLFRRVKVVRMPGFPEGSGFEVDGLEAGLNLIHGPNAVGKTTFARTMLALLWPRDDETPAEALAEADVALAGEVWRLELARRQVGASVAGAARALPAFPRGRAPYSLALPELLRAADQDSAQAVAVAARGGYSPMQAAKLLGYRDKAGSSGAVQAELGRTRTVLRELAGEAERLRGEEARLGELEAQHQRQEEARLLAAAVRQALAYRDAAEAQATAAARVAEFEPKLAELDGGEQSRLAELERRIAAGHEQLAAAREAAEDAARRAESRGLPEARDAHGLVTLQAASEALRAAEEALAAAGEQAAQRQGAVRSALAALGAAAADEELLAAEVDLSASEEHLRDRLTAEASHRAAEELERLTQAEEAPTERLRRSVGLLETWLDAGSSGTPWPAVVAALLAGLTFGVGGDGVLSRGLAWGSLLVVGAVLVFAVVLLLRPRDRRGGVEADFRGLGEPAPAWHAEPVRRHLADLRGRLAEAERDDRLRQRRAQATADRERSEAELARLDALRPAHLARFVRGGRTDATALWQLAEGLTALREARAELAAAEELQAAARQRHEAQRDAVQRLLQAAGAAPAESSAAARIALSDLADRQARWTEDTAAQRRHAADRDAALARLLELAGERVKLFDQAGLAAGEEHRLAAWCEQWPAFDAARQALREAGTTARLAAGAVTDPDLLDVSREALDQRLAAAERDAEQLAATREEMVRIRSEVAAAKQADRAARARAREAELLADLAAARDSDYQAVLGGLLAAEVDAQNRDRHLPEVLQRARRHFAAFTSGAYEVDVHDGRDGAMFVARPGDGSQAPDLEGLSSGTRVQLLLAVRLAFVETEEAGGPRLPLFLDEAIANSDDFRAREIVDAVAQLARERQVFYLTARQDEVATWERGLAAAGVPVQRVDLGELRRRQQRGTPLRPGLARAADELPDGLTREALFDRLSVPALDPRQADAHLWYVVDDPAGLTRLARLRVETVGQLRTVLRQGAGRAGPDAAALDTAVRRGEVLEYLCERWREGRGRPVDRTALEASGAVSAAFIERLTRLATELGGDAERLVAALRERSAPAAKGFQTAKLEELAAWLEEQGYLDSRPRLGREELVRETLAAHAARLDDGSLTVSLVEEWAARLPH